MRPLRLYIKDFMCYDLAYIDFTQFSSALMIAKIENNEAESNGAGKTTIFKAIEYVLFNQSNFNLERIIRDDTKLCKIVFDFAIDSQEYRLTRTRTNKGITDLSLYERTMHLGETEEVLHTDKYDPLFDDKYWKDKSGRRTADTEKDLGKLIKINYKSFRVFVHFIQNDFTGLATATPEKRKGILKDALNLIIYSKLEKLAKEKLGLLSKESERFNLIIENIGNPEADIIALSSKLFNTDQEIMSRNLVMSDLEAFTTMLNNEVNRLIIEHASLEEKFSMLLNKEQTLIAEKSRLEISVKEYRSKKSNIIKVAQDLLEEVKFLEETQVKLVNIDYSQIDILTEQIMINREKIAQFNLTIQNDIAECEELKIPLPADGMCKHCRQRLTLEHRKICQQDINLQMKNKQNNIQNSKKEIVNFTTLNSSNQHTIINLNLSKQHLDEVNTKIASKKKEIIDKRDTHDEYKQLLIKFTNDLENKNLEIESVVKELQNSSLNEAKELQKQIKIEKQSIADNSIKISNCNKELTHFNNEKAVIKHNLNQRIEDKQKLENNVKLLKELDSKLITYPSVLRAFSSVGIPNLIIHNILDDLQVEVNTLLGQFRPGLQLTFSIEKIQGDGTEADTLDITYQVNGRDRYYEQLSGAMQFVVNFSLKLGLSFLLQKMIGVNIQFLLLDEIDQSLDKARVDTFADIVKFLQKDFSILVITHNDRLKDKFSHAILVEQDIDMVSKAHVVSSW